ncbi:hypothetical protein LCGC14_1456860 [marine sediment metagenome]|uniref:DNA 5'-3' helicase n=1 Tax=marine sediment metagenome TaxID=412755 RepID=A0A0F9K2F1_9ZZZZ
MATEKLQMAPQNLEAEEAVLGSVLIDPKAISYVEALVKPNDFYKVVHGLIFKAMLQIRDNDQPIDTLTLTEWLAVEDLLETVGGAYYLTGLAERVPSAANVGQYARMVSEASQYRSLITIGTNVIKAAQDGADKPSAILAGIPSTIGSGSAEYKHVKELAGAVAESVKTILEEPGKSRGMSTGLSDLDSYTGGIQKNDLVIIGARPSMGKTSMAIKISIRFAKKGIPSLIISLESSGFDLAVRMAIQESKVSGSKYQSGYLTEIEGADLVAATKTISGMPVYINDSPYQDAYTIMASARHLAARHGIGLVIIDYIQRLEARGTQSERRHQIEAFCRRSKTLTKELDCPVIILSQLSRKPEGRVATKYRPILSDLKESGAIEEEADQVWLLYRPSYYGIQTYKDKSPTEGTCEIIIAKNRNGKRGAAIRVAFVEEYMLFGDLAEQGDVPF